MKKNFFYIILLFISFFGLVLRTLDYDRIPPFGETQDEFFYPWFGMTLFLKGVPQAWSLFPSYPSRHYLTKWGINYPIVSPWVEKPPLYSLFVGTIALLSGARELDQVRLSQIRIFPVFLSFFTIFLVGLLAKEIFSEKIGLISAALYTTIPTIVMANRLSLVENLMTPLTLLALYLFLKDDQKSDRKLSISILVAILSGLIALTKNIGMIIPLVFIIGYLSRKRLKEAMTVTVVSGIFSSIHPLMGAYFGLHLFLNVLKDYQNAHALIGLPELITTIFRFPTVGAKENLFVDGIMLLGYILFFSSPLWLDAKDRKNKVFLAVPFAYLVFLALLESGQTQFSYFGWHVYPLFPFMAILIGKFLFDLWENFDIIRSMIAYLLLAFSAVRFFLMINPAYQKLWQWTLLSILLIFISMNFLPIKYRRQFLLILLLLFLAVNVLVILNLGQIYRSFPQPES